MGSRKDYLKNREGYLRRARKNYRLSLQSPERRLPRMLTEAKCRAKVKDIEFSITISDVTWNEYCPIFGIKLVLDNEGAGGKYNSPSLDRIDNNKGYIPGNVRIISNKANKLKNTMTREECEMLLKNWYTVNA